MNKKKVIQTLYSGLGGHGNVVFSLLGTEFLSKYSNILIFFGVENVLVDYKKKVNNLSLKSYTIVKKRKKYFNSFNSFRKILTNEKPDVIIVHNSELIFTAVKYRLKNKNCKVVFVEHEPNHSKTFLEKIMSRYALLKSDIVVCLNNQYKKELILKYRCKSKIEVIANGIDVNTYRSTKKINSVSVIGMAARLVDTKDHKNLLLAFSLVLKEYPILKLKIAGTGELEKQLKNEVKELGICDSVDFLGLLNEKEMVEFYNSIDLYVHATYSETLSTSILQAMSCEKIVITSDIQNNKLLIDDNLNGVLYKNGDSSELYEKIKDLIDNYSSYKNLGKNGRVKVLENYSNIMMSENYQKLIDQ